LIDHDYNTKKLRILIHRRPSSTWKHFKKLFKVLLFYIWNLILMMIMFEALIYGWFFIIFCRLRFVKFKNLESMVWCCPWTFPKNCSYTIASYPKSNYLFFLIINLFATNYFNKYFPSFLITTFIFITTSLLFPTHQHVYEKINKILHWHNQW
jgi:hypothetical protein